MNERVVSSTRGGGEIDLLEENGRLRTLVAEYEENERYDNERRVAAESRVAELEEDDENVQHQSQSMQG